MGSGIADLEAKLERLPRLSAPLPPVITTPSGKPEIRLPHTANGVGPWSSGSPSDSILEARMVRRKYNQLSGDQRYVNSLQLLNNNISTHHIAYPFCAHKHWKTSFFFHIAQVVMVIVCRLQSREKKGAHAWLPGAAE